ncbi:MAG: methylmalonyl-CoA mutase [Betaproteobacteria bacterium]|nr:methylmalonyl-CoA mutase [Betaproteobacteria bacterium]
MSDLKSEFARWEGTTLKRTLDRSPERKTEFATDSGIPVKALYTPLDSAESHYREEIGFPGEYPYTRGVYPSMYRGQLWTMRQYAGFGTAFETNRRFRYLLERGSTGLSIAFDLPTQLGLDSDDPRSDGAVGRVGVAVDTLADMETVFRGIPLERVSVSMTINATAPILLAMVIAVGEGQGVAQAQLTGTTQNDILKEFIARGTYIFPPGPSLKLALDIVEYCMANIPRWNTMNIAGYHIREAGADAVQELAFTLADAITYIEKAAERGLAVDEFAPRLSYSLGCFRDLFEEVAKYRAARRLFAKIMKERFGAKDPRSLLFRTFSGSCGSTLVGQQPLNNIVRITVHALMGILGGHQAIHTASWDEGFALPSEQAAQIALRTQQILAHESGLANTIDPLAGSYYVESLTNEIERRASAYLEKIDAMGGMLKAIESGFISREIQESSVRYQKALDSGEKVVVGVNRYAEEEDGALEPDLFRIDPEVGTRQNENFEAVKAGRNAANVAAALTELAAVIDRGENVMPIMIRAVKAYASVGEITQVMRSRWGEYRSPVHI